MRSLVRTLVCTVLALAAGTVFYVSAADERSAHSAQWAEAAARQAQEAQRRQREARLRWEYERRRSAAHARMPNTLYASTTSNQAQTDLACPVLVNDDTRRLYRNSLKGQGPSSRVLRAPDLFRSGSSSKRSSSSGVRVFSAQGSRTANPSPWSSKSSPSAGVASHQIQASDWIATSIQRRSGTDTTHHVYLVPSASEPLREGFVRVINHSAEAGEVQIDPIDDGGRSFDTITLSIDANETVHFNSNDLETGNEGKGLTGSTGTGEGDWRLAFSSDLDIEVLAYIRTTDGFLTTMHDVVPADGDVHRVAIFNPDSNKNQVSRLRLINPTDATAEVTIRGTDDKGLPGTGEVSLSLDAGTASEISAELLEEGTNGLEGMLGDGSGKWRLEVESEQAVVAMSLLESPTDHLTNLSTVPAIPEDGMHSVPLFPAAGDDSGRQGFVRVINDSDTDGEVSIKVYDESERDYEPLTLTIGANEVVHFNSDDLEQGSPQKGLSGGTGAGEGDWRLELTSDLEIEVLSYIRTTDGFLTAMHDVAPSAETRHRVAVFNPGSNRNQESLLRLINPGDETAEVTITGIDDTGAASASAVSLSIPVDGTRTVGAWDLESGAEGLDGALGDGAGKWRLMIESDRPVVAMSLLRSPTGHLSNLSTAPVRGARGGSIEEPQTAETVFRQLISGPIVQSKCISCHVEGGASGNTRLVFVTDENPDHQAINLQVFWDLLDEEEDGASYILNKIQGALGHGGGIQVAAGTREYANMERFLSLLGEDVGSVTITPATLFDGVKMESARSTLRRAAIVFAGRIPTDEEYESINAGGTTSLRTAIRRLMEGPEFHEFLIRGSNDRLLTDRHCTPGNDCVLGSVGFLVDFDNEYARLCDEAVESGDESERRDWGRRVQFGAFRAPLELIAHVVERDLPYTEILTADYTMANATTAKAYGASTEFENPEDSHEFRPTEIVTYYRHDASKISRDAASPMCGSYIDNPGDLATNYPHAGVLNTKAFLQRYPTTATNRNRARSRWTYYHFLGIDIEKSASRTTDPVALADTNNPTMNNPACTVCHVVMDPVAGTFQNYGDEGWYRDQWGGLDSLDPHYKEHVGGTDFEVNVRSWEDAQAFSASGRFAAGANQIRFMTVYGGTGWVDVAIDYVAIRDTDGELVGRYEMEEAELELLNTTPQNCGEEQLDGGHPVYCLTGMIVEVPLAGLYDVEFAAWITDYSNDAAERPGRLRAWMPNEARIQYQEGDTWYRDMRVPGFGSELATSADSSLQWLAGKIVSDERFSEATVKFWWPAIMGGEVAEPPSDATDLEFEGMLLASNAQTAEVQRLAQGFRRGFGTGPPYNLKDLLVEIVLSKWFRAQGMSSDDPVRAVALRDAGARRLLTPEELARKTLALTGFQWGRPREDVDPERWPHQERWSALTDKESGYAILYGGIDSDGVIDRAADLTSVMAGVAQSHALESSCPIVMREIYLLPNEDRMLLDSFDLTVWPTLEFRNIFEIAATSGVEREAVSVTGHLDEGDAIVTLSFPNDFRADDGNYLDDKGRDRILRLDRLDVLNSAGAVVESVELEDMEPVRDNFPVDDHFAMHDAGAIDVPVTIAIAGEYTIRVVAWAERAGDDDELAKLGVAASSSNTETSTGARVIRGKLAELYNRLHGLAVSEDSPEVSAALSLFVDVWNRQPSGNTDFFAGNDGVDCDWTSDQHFLDGIVGSDGRAGYDWDWDRIFAHFDTVDWSDQHGVARTWTVVLAYLMMDYRYLYL